MSKLITAEGNIKGKREGGGEKDRGRLSEVKKKEGRKLKWERKKKIDVAKGRDRLSERE